MSMFGMIKWPQSEYGNGTVASLITDASMQFSKWLLVSNSNIYIVLKSCNENILFWLFQFCIFWEIFDLINVTYIYSNGKL